MRKTLAVVVARFQINLLTSAQQSLLKYAVNSSNQTLVVLGSPDVFLTNKNPLSFAIRSKMLRDCDYRREIVELKDHPDDIEWSKNLDKLIESYVIHSNENFDVVLFGGRDSFILHYKGNYPTHYYDAYIGYKGVSASKNRKKISILNQHMNNSSFRRGIIYAVENKFPTTYPTVDVVVINRFNNQILLGRKPGRDKYCFIGGFVDPTDASLEEAAYRELSEEVLGIETGIMKYLTSSKIDDFRYKGTKDGIITSLFITNYLNGTPKAGDDIEEVKWFSFNEAMLNISQYHFPLLQILEKLI